MSHRGRSPGLNLFRQLAGTLKERAVEESPVRQLNVDGGCPVIDGLDVTIIDRYYDGARFAGSQRHERANEHRKEHCLDYLVHPSNPFLKLNHVTGEIIRPQVKNAGGASVMPM